MRCLACGSDLGGPDKIADICPDCGLHIRTGLRDLLPLGHRLKGGRYIIRDVAGRGSFGVTYKSVDIERGRLAAIKEFFPADCATRQPGSAWVEASTLNRQRFRRQFEAFQSEARILGEISHRNVVRVLDQFSENGTAYLVMEWCTGVTLRDELNGSTGGRLTYERAKLLFGQAVDGLSAVHGRNILHLDLKPDNILIAGGERVILIDFGAAKTLNTRAQVQGGVSFALAYAAPEVLEGGMKGPYSDVFSLGMVIYEALAGQRAPGAMVRLYRDEFRGAPFSRPWNFLVNRALSMEPTVRPGQVKIWWKEQFGGRRS